MHGGHSPDSPATALRADVPPPAVMPVDREAWSKRLDLSNFVNAYYQYRDVQLCGDVRRILIVGPGQGLDTAVFRSRGYDVVTFDIDETFHPDVLGSVHDMAMFPDREFDVVIASHVLEHLALPYLDPALRELARVAQCAIVYLPATGRHVQARLVPGFGGLDLSLTFDVHNYFHQPDGVSPRYCGGQHFWEVGMRGFRRRDILRRFDRYFDLIEAYRNRDWILSENFILRSRQHAAAPRP